VRRLSLRGRDLQRTFVPRRRATTTAVSSRPPDAYCPPMGFAAKLLIGMAQLRRREGKRWYASGFRQRPKALPE
jgi:hypothetical protein